MKLFAPPGSKPLGEKIATRLGVTLSEVEERQFGDGEFKIRPLEDVRGERIAVVHSLFGETGATAGDKLCRMLFLIGALRDAGADRVTALVPYLAFSRKDRRTQPRDPITTRYVAQLFEAVGTDAIVTLDVHNLAAFENAFRIEAHNATAMLIFARHVASLDTSSKIVVASPDAGGMKRAHAFAATLSSTLGRAVPLAFVEKYRSLGRVSGQLFAGEVENADVLIIDDMITSGGTVARAAAACREHGARSVRTLATHGLFDASAVETICAAGIASVVVTDTVLPDPALFQGRETGLIVLESAELFAAAIESAD